MAPYGYSTGDTSVAGGVFILAGIVGSFVIGIILDKTQKYLLIYRILCASSLVFAVGFVWTLPSQKLYLLCINIFLLGLALLPIISVGFGFSVELAFPVSEALSNGWIVFWSQVVGFGFTYLATWLAEQEPRWCVLLFGIQMVIGVTVNFFLIEELRRLKSGQ